MSIAQPHTELLQARKPPDELGRSFHSHRASLATRPIAPLLSVSRPTGSYLATFMVGLTSEYPRTAWGPTIR